LRRDLRKVGKRLYCENIQSDRVKPYWIRGLNIIIDDISTCRQEIDKSGEKTGKFLYNNNRIGGEQTEQYIDVFKETFKDICKRHELNYAQMIEDLRTNGVTEVNKPTKKEDGSLHIDNIKSIQIDGKVERVVRLLRNKVYEKLGINDTPTKTEFGTLAIEEFEDYNN
jgi:hypothetical protein